MTIETQVLGVGIVSITAALPGTRVGVVCNVHGNEPCGRSAIRQLIENCSLTSGSLVLIDANPEAALLDQRCVARDLNRSFTEKAFSRSDPDHETARAHYLAKTLPTLGISSVIDLHSTSSATKFPFAVGFSGSEPLLEICPVAQISGWSADVMEGTLVEWLCQQGIPAVTVECGQHRSQEAVDVATNVLTNLLGRLGVLSSVEQPPDKRPVGYEICDRVGVTDPTSFLYTGSYRSFDELMPGELIATDKDREYRAPEVSGYSLLMPGEQNAINNGTVPDAYYLIRSTE